MLMAFTCNSNLTNTMFVVKVPPTQILPVGPLMPCVDVPEIIF